MNIWKKLLWPTVIVVVLVLGYFLISNFLLGDEGEVISTTPTTTIPYEERPTALPRVSSDSVSRMTITDKDGVAMTISRSGTKEDGTPVWEYMDDAINNLRLEFDQSALNQMVVDIAIFAERGSVDDGMDRLEEFGLETPAYTIKLEYINHDDHTVYIGDYTYDNKSVYAYTDRASAVAILPTTKRTTCERSVMDLLSKRILNLNPVTVDTVDFQRLFDNLDITAVLKLGDEESLNAFLQHTGEDAGTIYCLSEAISPIRSEGRDPLTNLLIGLYMLEATEYIELNPKDLSKYMLDDPAYTFTLKTKEEGDILVVFSENLGGKYYCYVSNYDAVFTVQSTKIEGMQTPYINMVNPFIFYTMISDIEKIEYKSLEGQFVLDVDVPKDKSPHDPESTLLLNGVDAKVKTGSTSYPASLCTATASLRFTDYDNRDTPTNTKDISIKVTKKDGTTYSVELAKRDDESFYAFVDGEFHGQIVADYLIHGNGGSDVYGYGAWALYQKTLEAIAGATNGEYPLQP